MISPGFSPAVLDDPVLFSFLFTISYIEDSSLQVSFRSPPDGFKSGQGGSDSAVVEVTTSILGSVGVLLLCGEATVVDDVLEGELHDSSLAAIVSIIRSTVDQLLFTEGNQVTGLFETLALHTSSGGEGPAASTGSLVLDWGHIALSSPVNLRSRFSIKGLKDLV